MTSALSSATPLRTLWCGHPSTSYMARGHRGLCAVCGSFWDLDFADRPADYAAAYPEDRGHFDPNVARNKVRTLDRWIAAVALDLSALSVCEIGFGGGDTLRYLHERAKRAFGVEVIQENIARAVSLGLPPERVFPYAALPAGLPREIDLWIFEDSFEHMPDPQTLLAWIVSGNRPASLLVVAPEAGSMSERWLGRWWPHKLPDHRFHWSRAGFGHLMAEFGFLPQKSFRPEKYVGVSTVLSHLAHKSGSRALAAVANHRAVRAAGWAFRFNVGEMGLLFHRSVR